jgi:hypothetical protein
MRDNRVCRCHRGGSFPPYDQRQLASRWIKHVGIEAVISRLRAHLYDVARLPAPRMFFSQRRDVFRGEEPRLTSCLAWLSGRTRKILFEESKNLAICAIKKDLGTWPARCGCCRRPDPACRRRLNRRPCTCEAVGPRASLTASWSFLLPHQIAQPSRPP